mmetsp:Transcript_48423/g.136882  ORF Transcript_48423/g.136882 Transcript_48423/m.136882 type:complete len:286 (-) Transcript_48423:285-1142(-)
MAIVRKAVWAAKVPGIELHVTVESKIPGVRQGRAVAMRTQGLVQLVEVLGEHRDLCLVAGRLDLRQLVVLLEHVVLRREAELATDVPAPHQAGFEHLTLLLQLLPHHVMLLLDLEDLEGHLLHCQHGAGRGPQRDGLPQNVEARTVGVHRMLHLVEGFGLCGQGLPCQSRRRPVVPILRLAPARSPRVVGGQHMRLDERSDGRLLRQPRRQNRKRERLLAGLDQHHCASASRKLSGSIPKFATVEVNPRACIGCWSVLRERRGSLRARATDCARIWEAETYCVRC